MEMRRIFLAILLFICLTSEKESPFFATNTLYFEASGSVPVTPATTGWSASGSAIVAPVLPNGFKQGTTIASTTITVDNGSSTNTTLFYRGCSPALVAQTISGTVTGYFRMNVSNATGCTAQTRVKIFLVHRNGTAASTLLAITAGASNLTTTLTSYQALNAANLTSQTCSDGDYLVIEVGIGRSSGTTSRNGVISFGSSSTTDITTAGSTTANNPNLVFSNAITFYKGIIKH